MLIIGISGVVASGKNLVAKMIKMRVSDVLIMRMKYYCKPQRNNQYSQSEVDITQMRADICAVRDTAGYHQTKILIVIGVFALDRSLADLYDLRVMMQCDSDVSFARHLLRDRNDEDINKFIKRYEGSIRSIDDIDTSYADIIIDTSSKKINHDAVIIGIMVTLTGSLA